MPASIAALLTSLSKRLAAVSASPRLDAEVLLSHVLVKPKTYLYTWPERCLDDTRVAQLEALCRRRLSGVPVAYLTGHREFWSLDLLVTPDTLIPRPDTELLVEQALAWLRERGPAPATVLDLGTGSGAIALAIASERPACHVTGVDRVPAAVTLAQRNQRRLGIENASFLESDWFAALKGQRFALIVSNPPYIDPVDAHLEEGDVRFEPHSALVAGRQGLQDIERIVSQAPDYLLPEGALMLEHGYAQGLAVRALLVARGFDAVVSHCDLAGHERVTFGTWSA